MRRGLAPAFAVLAIATACSKSYDPADEPVPRPVVTSTDAGQGAPEASAPFDPEGTCRDFATRICEGRKPCCLKTVGYDEAACNKARYVECLVDATAVQEGRATYHPERVAACELELRALYDRCETSFALTVSFLKGARSCRIFEGQLAEGQPCTRDTECALPSATSAVSVCDETSKTCIVRKILAAGVPCSLANPLRDLCDTKLFCNADFQVTEGQCELASSLGGSCALGGPPFQCGFGNYCNPDTALCSAGKGGGAPCRSPVECASASCVSGGAGNVCESALPLLQERDCK